MLNILLLSLSIALARNYSDEEVKELRSKVNALEKQKRLNEEGARLDGRIQELILLLHTNEARIAQVQKQIDTRSTQLDKLEAAITNEKDEFKRQKIRSEFNKNVDEYNHLLESRKILINDQNLLIDKYNEELERNRKWKRFLQ